MTLEEAAKALAEKCSELASSDPIDKIAHELDAVFACVAAPAEEPWAPSEREVFEEYNRWRFQDKPSGYPSRWRCFLAGYNYAGHPLYARAPSPQSAAGEDVEAEYGRKLLELTRHPQWRTFHCDAEGNFRVGLAWPDREALYSKHGLSIREAIDDALAQLARTGGEK